MAVCVCWRGPVGMATIVHPRLHHLFINQNNPLALAWNGALTPSLSACRLRTSVGAGSVGVFRSDAMLSDDKAQAASDLLWAHWRQGRRIAALPEPLRPATRAEGYAIQSRLERRSEKPLFGWKIAATSRAGQIHIGVDGPLAGRLLAERVYETGSTLPFGANHMRVVEMEFAFRLGCDLLPREAPYLLDEILDAVD